MVTAALPLFHLYGDPPDDQAFDFIHIETIASRSSIHDWTIRAHRHRNLFQILLIESGGGEMTFEAATIGFDAPCAILVPATVAHGFRFRPAVTDGWVMTFTEDVAEAMGDRRGEALARLKGLAAEPVVPPGHLIRQRVLTEAKRQLVFTSQPIHEIAYELAFSDPSHFARFFRKQTGTTPHEFRAARG